MRYILDHLINALEQGQSAVLAAIVRNSGSAPRTSGARMLMLVDGTSVGSIGGGALEGTCQAKAGKLFLDSRSFAELNFELNASSAADAGMLCGGAVSVLLHRVDSASLDLFRQIHNEYMEGKRPVLLTMLPTHGRPPRLMSLGNLDSSDLPEGLRAEILRKTRRMPFLVNCGNQEIFIEPLVHPGRVHLVGAGHVALATAQLAAFVGFEVVVMDDRAEFASTNRYPQAREVRVLDTFNNCFAGLGPDDYVIIVTRGHMHDREVLAQALRTRAGYVGMIGSRRKRDAIYTSLRGEGFTEADFKRVHCPIGLAIGADTPEEIALCIMAELVQVRAGMST
jgi:xanthine dehydrogenase accessory factor